MTDISSLFNQNTQPIDMMTADPQSVLQNQFFQTPQYQLLFGNNTNVDPYQRFAADQGTQLAVHQGQDQLQMQMAAHGLGQSGALAKDMGNYMYGQYGNYLNSQNSLFNNYQQQLNNLMGVGVNQSGANNAMTAGQNQANTVAGANLNTGSNISSLFANQGVYNANALLNTGAASANNLFNGMGLLSQINQNAIAGQNSQQASLFNGLGQASGMSGGMY